MGGGTKFPTVRSAEQYTARLAGFQPLILELGKRLRGLRERRGLSLAQLATETGLSRRYLTETEAGRANPSLEVLLRLSIALAEPLPRLLDLPLRTRPDGRIALIGLRGAGKSSVGPLLARALECPFVELDQRVEELAGMSLGEIFPLHGEAAFHRFESEALERVLAQGERVVIATGGSIVESPACWERLKATCRTVWLAAEPEDHLARVAAQGDLRPMRQRPRALEELRSILAAREPRYAQCEIKLATSGRTPEEVAEEIAAQLVREA